MRRAEARMIDGEASRQDLAARRLLLGSADPERGPVAAKLGTVGYEITARIGPRAARVQIERGGT